MGASASKEDVASHVLEIGAAYAEYASVVTENGIDGQTLADYDSIASLLAELELTPKQLHLKRLEKEFQATRATHTTAAPAPKILKALVKRASSISLKKETGVMASDAFHLFISYRQKTERAFALDLYQGIRAQVADKDFGVAGDKPRPFLDLK